MTYQSDGRRVKPAFLAWRFHVLFVMEMAGFAVLWQSFGLWIFNHEEVYYRLPEMGFQWLTGHVELSFQLGRYPYFLGGLLLGVIVLFCSAGLRVLTENTFAPATQSKP